MQIISKLIRLLRIGPVCGRELEAWSLTSKLGVDDCSRRGVEMGAWNRNLESSGFLGCIFIFTLACSKQLKR